MSRLGSPNADDHPDAAHKHLLDAGVLLAQKRADGAAYLSGYVVECALKSLWLHETGALTANAIPRGKKGHDLGYLATHVSALAAVAGAKSARYFKTATSGVPSSAIAAWTPEMRYRSPTMALVDAESWHACARNVFQETVHQMRLDGVL